MRVLITHDFFETFGGAERVTAEIAAAFPEAPVYAILGRPSVAARMGISDRVHTVLPGSSRLFDHYRRLAPLYPRLVRSARLPEADVIVSSSYAYSHAFETPNRARKLCYCHGPLRHLWSQTREYASHMRGGTAARLAFNAYMGPARRADRAAADSTDAFITQSPFTAKLIERAYGRNSQVLPPPVDCDVFRPSYQAPDDYFLFVGRLVEPYKRPSMVIDAFARMPHRRLLIAGDGPALAMLRERATPNVEFLGQLHDEDLVHAMQNCQAAIFPSVDDYGLVPLEINACGRPVLAVQAGGTLHTVKPGVTGQFLSEQSADAIVTAVEAFDSHRYDVGYIREHALERSSARFREEIRAAAERLLGIPQPAVTPMPARRALALAGSVA